MTSSHSNCSHPATKAARAKCRRDATKIDAQLDRDEASRMTMLREQDVRHTASERRVDEMERQEAAFALLPEVEDDWYDGPIYDPREGDADILDR